MLDSIEMTTMLPAVGRVEQPHEGDGLSCALAHGGLQGYVTSASNSPKDLPEGLPPPLVT